MCRGEQQAPHVRTDVTNGCTPIMARASYERQRREGVILFHGKKATVVRAPNFWCAFRHAHLRNMVHIGNLKPCEDAVPIKVLYILTRKTYGRLVRRVAVRGLPEERRESDHNMVDTGTRFLCRSSPNGRKSANRGMTGN